MTPGLTVFIPLYNEEAILKANTETVLAYARKFGMPFEILLGSNGSTDRTPEIGKELAAAHPEVVFFHIPERGPGRAFAEGLRRARYEYFVCLDGDLSFGMDYVDNAITGLKDFDAVIGSKQMGSQKRPLMRIIASGSFIWLTNLLLRLPYKDYSIGAKAYRTESIRPYVDNVDAETFYTQEMVYQIMRHNGKITEIPVTCVDKRASKFNLLHEGFYRYGKLFGLWFRSFRD